VPGKSLFTRKLLCLFACSAAVGHCSRGDPGRVECWTFTFVSLFSAFIRELWAETDCALQFPPRSTRRIDLACRHLGGRLRGCVRTILAQLHLQRPPTALFRPFRPQTQIDSPQPPHFFTHLQLQANKSHVGRPAPRQEQSVEEEKNHISASD